MPSDNWITQAREAHQDLNKPTEVDSMNRLRVQAENEARAYRDLLVRLTSAVSISQFHGLLCEAKELLTAHGVKGLDPAKHTAAEIHGCEVTKWSNQQCVHGTYGCTATHGVTVDAPGNRCGCSYWMTKPCPSRNCPWQGKRPVDAGVKELFGGRSKWPEGAHYVDEKGNFYDEQAQLIGAREAPSFTAEWLFANCRIVFFPPGNQYPVEHNPHAMGYDKDGSAFRRNVTIALGVTASSDPKTNSK